MHNGHNLLQLDMANLKEIRTRISSVTTTKQVTSAMKMVSAAKLKKAQDAITQMKPYAEKLQSILSGVSSVLADSDENIYGQSRAIEKVLILSITSNKGLCGAFNSNIIKATKHLIEDKYSAQFTKGDVYLYTIGKKGHEILSKEYSVYKNNNDIVVDLNFENVEILGQAIMDAFVNKEFDAVEIVYNSFKNAGTQVVINEQFLPIKIVESDDSNMDYIFEPSKETIVKEIIPKSLKVQLLKTISDSVASEHGARMTAMHKATDNAGELIKELTLNYNKARQAAITNEILEIVSGANALNG